MSGSDETLYSSEYELLGDMDQHQSSVGLVVTEGLISFIGFVFNVVVILLICVLRDYRKTSHWYVLNLAVADGVFLVILPFNIAQQMKGSWTFGRGTCYAYFGLRYVSYYVGIFILVVMSFDRYVAIVHPMSTTWRGFRSRKGSLLITLMVWILATVIAIPLLLMVGTSPTCYFPKADQRCVDHGISPRHCPEFIQYLEGSGDSDGLYGQGYDNNFSGAPGNVSTGMEYFAGNSHLDSGHTLTNETEGSGDTGLASIYDYLEDGSGDFFPTFHFDDEPLYPTWYFAWVICDFVLTFVLPVVFMVVCYGCIVWRMQHPRVQSTRSNSYRAGRRTSGGLASGGTSWGTKDVQVLILVASLVIAFIACWLPFNAALLYDVVHEKFDDEKAIGALKLLGITNSLLNPVLYTFLGINFRRRLRLALSRISSTTDSRDLGTSFKYVKNKDQVVTTQITKTNTKGTDSSDVTSGASGNMQIQVLAQVCFNKGDENMNDHSLCSQIPNGADSEKDT